MPSSPPPSRLDRLRENGTADRTLRIATYVLIIIALIFIIASFGPILYAQYAPPGHFYTINSAHTCDADVGDQQVTLFVDRTSSVSTTAHISFVLHRIHPNDKTQSVQQTGFNAYIEEGRIRTLIDIQLEKPLTPGRYFISGAVTVDLDNGITRTSTFRTDPFRAIPGPDADRPPNRVDQSTIRAC